jgi:hypothetical protein
VSTPVPSVPRCGLAAAYLNSARQLKTAAN